jgi:hypothetical protein
MHLLKMKEAFRHWYFLFLFICYILAYVHWTVLSTFRDGFPPSVDNSHAQLPSKYPPNIPRNVLLISQTSLSIQSNWQSRLSITFP